MSVSEDFKKRYGSKEYKKRLEDARKKMNEKKSGRRDAFEYRFPKADKDKTYQLRLRVLPELTAGEPCEGGVAKEGMDNWYYQHGYHWVEGLGKVECPRIHDNEQCEICQIGFDLLNETDDEEHKKTIKRKYLATQFGAVNAYFLDTDKNPEEVRGKTLWISFGKTIMDKLHECLSRDDAGDKDDPHAFGLFFDVTQGHTLLVEVKKKGEYNNYDQSKLLQKGSPLAKDKDGEADWEKIKEILDHRHDIPAKFAKRSKERVKEAIKRLTKGSSKKSSDSEWEEDETKPDKDEESKEERPETTKPAKPAKEEKEKPEPEAEAEAEPEADDDNDEELQALLADMEGDE